MEAKGKVLLKVMGIIMIVGGAISVIVSIFLAIAAAGLIAVGGPALLIIGVILTILGSVAELIAGIICTKNAAKPENATKCMVWSIIVLVLQLLGVILVLAGSAAMVKELTAQGVQASINSTPSTIISIVVGIVIPVLAIIGAVMNKKSYDASRGVQTSFSSIAGEMKEEVKNMDDDVAGLAKEAKEKAEDAKDKVVDFAEDAKEKTAEAVDNAKEKAAEAVDNVKEKAADIAEDAKEKVEEVKDKFDGKDEQ